MDCTQRSVLVVDDEPTISELVTVLLESDGYHVKTAWNGQDALDQLESWQPDLIILDMLMPVMDGAAFLAAQQANPRLRAIPVIGMSASLRGRPIGDGLATRVMLSKPFRIDDLLAHVATLTSDACLAPA
jgi:CheY-like chemotaxis protein